MASPDRFDSSRRKLDRAREHIGAVEAVVIAYHRSNPYRVVVEPDWELGRSVARVGDSVDPVPDAIPLILGDAIHAMRSSLDHFANAAVPNPSRDTAFPIWRAARPPRPADINGIVNGKLAGASKALIRGVKAAEPYRGGKGEFLWVLDELDISTNTGWYLLSDQPIPRLRSTPLRACTGRRNGLRTFRRCPSL
jgi:hypothetical protein